MGFAGYYPDGTDQETAQQTQEMDKPTPVPANTTPELVPKETEVIPAPDEKLSEKEFVIDTFHNKTSINTDRAAQVVADLKGYAEGSILTVTYYKQTAAETNSKGIQSDVDIQAHQTHKSLLRIHGFEMRSLGSLQYEHDAGDNVSRVTGEAVTYPGFNPSKGDKFIMEIEPGKYGEMDVIEVPARMSIKSSTYFKIAFSMVNWMSNARQVQLDNAVIDEAYFDKQRFLNEPGALLYHAEYMDMKFMELQSAQMVRFYSTKFLDKDIMFTFMRPDLVYDPYVTDFMLKITEFNEFGQVAAQLFKDAPSMENSIWRALLSETVPLACVPTSSIVSRRVLGSKTVMANSLLNRFYVAWEPDSTSLLDFFAEETASTTTNNQTTDPLCSGVSMSDLADAEKDKIIGDLLLHIHPHYHECILTCKGSCSACCGDPVADDSNSALSYLLEGTTNYKKLIRSFLKERKINATCLRDCISKVYQLDPIEQFYKIPVYIFLARTFVRYIHNTAGIYE